LQDILVFGGWGVGEEHRLVSRPLNPPLDNRELPYVLQIHSVTKRHVLIMMVVVVLVSSLYVDVVVVMSVICVDLQAFAE
jgi:hypothetical protein